MLMPAPTKLPWRTSYGATFTCTCSSASSEIGVTLVRSPGCPPRPNELLKYDPSIVMLFSRLSCPANENPSDIGLYCGLSRSRSSTRRLIVGRWASASVGRVVGARRRRVRGPGRHVHRDDACAVQWSAACRVDGDPGDGAGGDALGMHRPGTE